MEDGACLTTEGGEWHVYLYSQRPLLIIQTNVPVSHALSATVMRVCVRESVSVSVRVNNIIQFSRLIKSNKSPYVNYVSLSSDILSTDK